MAVVLPWNLQRKLDNSSAFAYFDAPQKDGESEKLFASRRRVAFLVRMVLALQTTGLGPWEATRAAIMWLKSTDLEGAVDPR